MTRHSIIKSLLILLSFLNNNNSFSQKTNDYVREAKTLPIINNKATVKGFSFEKTIYSSRDSLNNGFEVILQDQSYKIVSFLLTYDCEDCDIWEKVIYGKAVSTVNIPILRKIKKGDLLNLSFFKVEKEGKFYTLPETIILVIN